MTADSIHSLPEEEGGALKRVPESVQPLKTGETQAQTDANLAKQDQIHQAEQSAETADRQGQIELFLMENDLFGFEPYSPEVLADLSDLLVKKETLKRQSKPEFNITSDWSSRKTLGYFDKKYTAQSRKEEKVEKTDLDENYADQVAALRENNPDITNVELCTTLLETPKKIPSTEIAKLQAFVSIQELAATPEDAAIVTAKINAQDFSAGSPQSHRHRKL